MNYLGIGDLATSTQARRQNSDLRIELNRLTAELSSGLKDDLSKVTRGHTAPVASIERSLLLNETFSQVADQAALELDILEGSLNSIGSSLNGLGASILGAANTGVSQVGTVISSASDRFDSAISALSVQVAGEYIFSGIADEQAPLVSAQEFLVELEVVTSGAATATDFRDRVLTWFDDPGGFEAFGYRGAQPSQTTTSVSSTNDFNFDLTANSDGIRQVLSSLAMVALIDRGSFSGSEEEQIDLAKMTAENLLSANDRFIEVQASVGEAQKEIALAQTQNGSEKYTLTRSKNELLGVDAFEVATRLEKIQLQLESFYLITAKTSRLNLTEYLR